MINQAEYEQDIKNTEKEMEAYRMLADGYATLADLPENKNRTNGVVYRNQSYSFRHLYDQCSDFYNKLLTFGAVNFPDVKNEKGQDNEHE